MSTRFTIKKGLDIPIKGAAAQENPENVKATLFAITPDDFPGYSWKPVVKPGDHVKSGDAMLAAKEAPEVVLAAPVAGEIAEIRRGARRKIEFISIKSDCKSDARKFDVDSTNKIRDAILNTLAQSGLYAMMRQRPFDIVPQILIEPRDIFITTFDSAPLAPALISESDFPMLENGIEILQSLTPGKVYLGIRPGFTFKTDKAAMVEFDGPHPAGNVGVQINHIAPVNKGEVVWTLDARTASRIGRLFTTGIADFSTCVAVTGPEVRQPKMVNTFDGASIEALCNGNLKDSGEKSLRIISGNVLTGEKTDTGGFLRFPYRQITVIAEGDNADEFMGWASLNPKKFSVKRSFPAFLRGNDKEYNFDSRILGGHRAMILSGEYDNVFPFDIYPEYLLKAIIAKNIDKMEQLGIYEVAPEDFALPEFVDTSKLPLQQIVREGLNYLRKES